MTRRTLIVLAAVLALAADDAKQDLGRMQGTWVVVAAESNGKQAPADDLKKSDLRLTIKGNRFAYQAGNNTLLEGTLSIDPGKKPKTLDAKGTSPDGKVTATVGIYRFDGDKLQVCFVPAGHPRPKEFKAAPDSGASIIVYQRAKP
jgi:uncharacterized protein (TIGR03067 family)